MKIGERQAYLLLFILSILVCFFMLFIVTEGFAKDRCEDYIPDVRQQYTKYFGAGFPYWYGIGQLAQESQCRANITAFDGGQGLAQFMPATEKYVEGLMHEDLDMYNPEHAIKAQAFYMSNLHKQNWNEKLWLSYCFYNSGPGTMKKEYVKAKACLSCHIDFQADYALMKSVCKRKVLTLKSGQKLDLCSVGYDYPCKIYSYGQKYVKFTDSWRYW